MQSVEAEATEAAEAEATTSTPEGPPPDSRHCAYVLRHAATARTYAGYTVDVCRRLRQHNGDLVGGARATSRTSGGWGIAMVVRSPDFDACDALSFEWRLKHPPAAAAKGMWGLSRRIAALGAAVEHPRFQPKRIHVHAAPDLVDAVRAALPARCSVSVLADPAA